MSGVDEGAPSPPSLSVVRQLHAQPLLTDVPGRLRHLADLIERGEVTQPQWALVVLDETADDFSMPNIYSYGEALPKTHVAGIFTYAAHVVLTA